ncbi:MAG: hypothetical protein QM757_00700 [Paludibaculum sp.]
MSEITKSEQARINGRRSRGPVTAGGKARSASNARKHGRYARPLPEPVHPILLKCENGAAYQDVLHRLFQDILPTNSFEIALVREVCAIEWLITRNFAVQTRLLDVQVAAECDAIRRGQGSLRGIEPIDGITLATEKLLTSSNVLAQSRREFTRLQRARREAMNMIFSLRNHQQSLVRSQELPDAEDFDRRTAEGDIHRNEPTDWPLENQEGNPRNPTIGRSRRSRPGCPNNCSSFGTTNHDRTRTGAGTGTSELEPEPKQELESELEQEPEQELEQKRKQEREREHEQEHEQAPSAQPVSETNPASPESSAPPLEPVPEPQRRAKHVFSTEPSALAPEPAPKANLVSPESSTSPPLEPVPEPQRRATSTPPHAPASPPHRFSGHRRIPCAPRKEARCMNPDLQLSHSAHMDGRALLAHRHPPKTGSLA